MSRRPRVRPQKPQVVQAERAGACLVGRLGVRREGRKGVRSVDRWEVWTVGRKEGRSVDRWEVWTVGRKEGRLEDQMEGRLGEQREGFLAGLRTGKVLLQEAAQELQCRQKHPQACCRVGTASSSSRAFSAEVFLLAMVAPISPTWRGLNSGCVPGKLLQPAWCRGYHAGLSFLRPGFNSRSGRHTIPLPSEPVHRTVFDLLWRASGTTSTATPTANQGSSQVEFGTSIQTQ